MREDRDPTREGARETKGEGYGLDQGWEHCFPEGPADFDKGGEGPHIGQLINSLIEP